MSRILQKLSWMRPLPTRRKLVVRVLQFALRRWVAKPPVTTHRNTPLCAGAPLGTSIWSTSWNQEGFTGAQWSWFHRNPCFLVTCVHPLTEEQW
eukprot:s157_g21.t1